MQEGRASQTYLFFCMSVRSMKYDCSFVGRQADEEDIGEGIEKDEPGKDAEE